MHDTEEELMTLRKSRKAFLLEYGCAILIIISLLFLLLRGVTMKPFLVYLALGLALFAIIYAEINRELVRYKITQSKLIIVTGIIKQSKKNVYWHPLGFVPDINLKQGRIQRILDYGTIFIASGGDNSLEIKDVNNPHHIMEFIEELIEETRKRGQKTPEQNRV